LRLEVEAARAWGVPHSVITGRVVSDGEPQWQPLDTAYAVALTALEQVTCNGCGQDRRESLDPGSEFAYRAEAVRCFACATRERAAEKFKDDESAAGLLFTVTRKDDKKGGGGR